MRIAARFFCLIAVLAVQQCFASTSKADDLLVNIFTNEINNWSRTGNSSQNLDEIINALALPPELQRVDWRTFTGERGAGICTLCKSFAKTIIRMRQWGSSTEEIQNIIAKLCTRLNLSSERVCYGVVEINTPIILYIVDSDPEISAHDVCGIALQSESCTTVSDKYEWNVEIDSGPPQEIEAEATEETIKILQITDIHYDPLYEPNGNSHCDDPTCCRKGQNETNTSGELAGFWGDYNNCDSPWHAVEDALDHLKTTQNDVDYVYFTGDIIDHGVWETSKRRNTQSLIKSYDAIKNTFETTPVYPLIGNHEPHPLNVFAPSHITDEDLSTQWVYSLMADLWIKNGWLPESTRETIMRGGFYTVSPKKGFRVIALNNNVCYTFNWWLVYEPQDPDNQLRWLAETLLEAEKNGEFVHILSHIPPRSHDCYITWSNEFRKIVNRFAHIISAQFNGHTHYDEFCVFYHPEDPTKAINVAWNGGGITPFSNLNPNYKVYTANANTYIVEEIDNWIYNLTRANETPEKRPEWYKSYSFKQEYGLENLSLANLDEWIVGMSANINELETYRNNYHKYADSVMAKECDEECLKKYLCKIVTTSARDNTQCDYLSVSSSAE